VTRAILRTSFKVNRSGFCQERSGFRLTQTYKMCHIFRTVRPKARYALAVLADRHDRPSKRFVVTDRRDGHTFLKTVSTVRRDGCSVRTALSVMTVRRVDKHCTTMLFLDGPSRRLSSTH